MRSTSHQQQSPITQLRRARVRRFAIIGLVFALLGTIFIWRSFAANPNLPGDVNNDNRVNITDLSVLLTNFGKASASVDLNGDGQVNITDLSILLTNFGRTYGGNPSPNPPGPTPTPPSPNPNPGTQPAITRDGTRLMRAGKQWKFAGINADKWFGCWGGAQVPSDAQLDKYFRELNPGSATRIWPYGHMGQVGMMDKVVSYAEKYNQYLVVTLFDGNSGQCGTKPIDKGNPQTNINQIQDFVKRYAKGTGSNATNSIAFWESSNEACGDNTVNWFIKMADALKALDPNTLVTTGSMPRYCYSGQAAYEAAHGGKNDLISIHEYDNGYSHWSGPAIEAAKKLNKPWFSGESGLCCGGGDTGNESSNASKAKGEMDQYINQPESAGMLYWASRTTSAAYDVNINGGPMWDMFKNYRHAYQGQ